MTLVGQVHVDAVGARVIGHRQLVVAMVTHLLHDLRRWTEDAREVSAVQKSTSSSHFTLKTGMIFLHRRRSRGSIGTDCAESLELVAELIENTGVGAHVLCRRHVICVT